MGAKQARHIALANMVVGAAVVFVVGLMLLLGKIGQTASIFGFLTGISALFYGFTVFQAVGAPEVDQTTFHMLRKRAGSSWLVPTLMTIAPPVTGEPVNLPVLCVGLCAVIASVLLDICIRNGAKGR